MASLRLTTKAQLQTFLGQMRATAAGLVHSAGTIDPTTTYRRNVRADDEVLPGFGEVEFDHMQTKRYKPGINQVLNTWLAGERAAPEAALFDPSGRPRQGIVQKLMSERDSRPITITE